MKTTFTLIFLFLTLASAWAMFKKMGHRGWEGIAPLYNLYIICRDVYGNGMKFLYALIPLYNIYFVLKTDILLAQKFNQTAWFGVGLFVLPFVFQSILGFGDAQYDKNR